jgi:hypothetical protein
MKACTIILFSFLVFAFIEKAEAVYYYQHKNSESKIENSILSRLNRLPEVRSFIRKGKKEGAMLIVERKPGSTFKYYWVKLGLSNFDIFRTATDFYVNPKTHKIYFLDLMDNSGEALVPLQQWRRLRSDPRFYKLHKIEADKIILTK